MNLVKPITVTPTDARWPRRLTERLREAAPQEIWLYGNAKNLSLPKTALLCSARCPSDVVLRTYDQAGRWRDSGRCIISGFHSDIEKECLRILLRGRQPIIICPARALPIRVPRDWKVPLIEGRVLLLSCFAPNQTRVTTELATIRNEFVAALGDEIWIPHAREGGMVASLRQRLAAPH